MTDDASVKPTVGVTCNEIDYRQLPTMAVATDDAKKDDNHSPTSTATGDNKKERWSTAAR